MRICLINKSICLFSTVFKFHVRLASYQRLIFCSKMSSNSASDTLLSGEPLKGTEALDENITLKSAFSRNKCEEATDSESIKLDRCITIDTTPYTIVNEGKAEVLFPSSHDVFYNPVQEFNRDISIAILKQFVRTVPKMTKGLYGKLNAKYGNDTQITIRVLEALSASGLRSVRYAKEVKGLTQVLANDMCSQAFESIKRNISYNKVENIVIPSQEDAALLMYKNKKKFDVVDIDPYGTASPFLDSAVQSVTDGGLLMVTCTDMAVLCGNGIEACHAKYGSVSINTPYCHEMALRIVLRCIESHANRYGRYIEPILSLSADFYVRLFVQIYTGPVVVKKSICKLSMVYVCQGCHSFHLQPLGKSCVEGKSSKYTQGIGPPVNMKCDICGGSHKICGPVWSANMHNKDFIRGTLELVQEEEEQYKTSKRILGMLNVILEELDDCPLFHKIDRLASTVHVVTPSVVQFRSALLHAGYRVSISHTLPTSIKTDAPQSVIWDIIRAWANLYPGNQTFENDRSKFIMSRESSIEVSFEPRPDANPVSRINHLVRFQVNPERFWGPKSRAKTSLFCDKDKEKQIKFQGKRKKKEKSEGESETVKKCKKLKEDEHQREECQMEDNCQNSVTST